MSDSVKFDIQIAGRFKLVRLFLEMTQKEMGELLGLAQSMVNYMEKGERDIPLAALKILLVKKNISPVYILVGGVPMEHAGQKEPLQVNMLDFQAELQVMAAVMKRQGEEIKSLKEKLKAAEV